MINSNPARLLAVVPQIIIPLKIALNSKNPVVIVPVLRVIQMLLHADHNIGVSLVPYYRQLLPAFSFLQGLNVDTADVSDNRRVNVATLARDTLELLEEKGGQDAYIMMKYMIPTFDSFK